MLCIACQSIGQPSSMLPVMSLANCHGQCSQLIQVSVAGLYRDSSEIGEVGFSRASVNGNGIRVPLQNRAH